MCRSVASRRLAVRWIFSSLCDYQPTPHPICSSSNECTKFPHASLIKPSLRRYHLPLHGSLHRSPAAVLQKSHCRRLAEDTQIAVGSSSPLIKYSLAIMRKLNCQEVVLMVDTAVCIHSACPYNHPSYPSMAAAAAQLQIISIDATALKAPCECLHRLMRRKLGCERFPSLVCRRRVNITRPRNNRQSNHDKRRQECDAPCGRINSSIHAALVIAFAIQTSRRYLLPLSLPRRHSAREFQLPPSPKASL